MKTEIWIDTVPTLEGAESDAYRQAEERGEVLHVLSVGPVTRVLCRSEPAAWLVVDEATGEMRRIGGSFLVVCSVTSG